MNVRRHFAVALIGSLAVGCNRPQPETVAPGTAMCSVSDVGSVARAWRQVRGNGFSFCVPPDWVPFDGRPVSVAQAWERGSSRIEWAPGPAQWSFLERTGLAAVQLAGTLDAPQVCPPLRSVVAAGQRVEIAACGSGSRYQTLAYWRDLGVHFSGLATTFADADLHLSIYRTLRANPDSARPPSNSIKPE